MKGTQPFIRIFREIQPKFARIISGALMEAGLTLPQYTLLNLVATAGQMPMTEASAKLYITKPAVTNLADRLEKNHFLKRIPHPRDRRVFLLEIQPKGQKIVRKVQATILNFLLKTLHHFSEAERAVITRFYRSLSNVLDETLLPSRKR